MSRKKTIEIIQEDESKSEEKFDEIENFEDFFKQAGEGWSISVYREEPTELQGFLEERPYDPKKPVDIPYLAREWGGQRLRIMLRGPDGKWKQRQYLNLKSYPPLFHQRPMNWQGYQQFPFEKQVNPVNNESNILNAAKILKELQPPMPIHSSIGQSNTNEPLMRMMEIVLTNQMAQINNMQKLSQSSQTSQNSVQNLNEMMGFLAGARDFWKPINEPSDNLQSGDPLSSIMKIAEAVLTRSPTQQKTGNILPPTHQRIEHSKKQQDTGMSFDNLSEILQNISGEDAVGLFLLKLKNLNPHDRAKAEGLLLESMGMEIETDDTTEISKERNSDTGKFPGSDESDR